MSISTGEAISNATVTDQHSVARDWTIVSRAIGVIPSEIIHRLY